jgi:hypothetical protein
MAMLVLLIDQADVVERLELAGLGQDRQAKLADSLAKRLGDLLERRQVAAAGQSSGLCCFLRVGGELERGLARDAAAADHVLD